MRLLDTAEIKDVQSFIVNESTLNIKVNFYQRPYRWPEKKVNDLFEDYMDNRKTAISTGNSREYFFGAVVFVDERGEKEKANGKEWKYQVVDGQQRFTTLFLFNYIKYLLLIKKVDEAAQKNRSSDFTAGLNSMIDCYRGYIGSNNVEKIIKANKDLNNAFDSANQRREAIDRNDLNKWRESVGWISDPDISSADYYDKCKNAMEDFLKNEKIRIQYENNVFNTYLKDAMARIVFMFSDASDVVFCEDAIDVYDSNEEKSIDFPYVMRSFNIYKLINKYYREEIAPNVKAPFDKLCGYIDFIDEMLKNIKLCMIVTSNEDDAYKLFETLNDRSESVNDLELLKNYFYKTYIEYSGDDQSQVNEKIAVLDSKWREVFFKYEELESEIFEYMTVLFTGVTRKLTNEKKRKAIRAYLYKYNSQKPYTYERITRDFTYMEYIQKILLRIHRIDNTTLRINQKEESQLSLYIENDPESSIVKRALGLALNIPYPVVLASIICDILHNYNANALSSSFDLYLDDVLKESVCRDKYPGLWKDTCTIWKAMVLSSNYEKPKLLSDVLASNCNIEKFDATRDVKKQLVQFDANIFDEDELYNEFGEWVNQWKFSDGHGKIKIKNLFMHLFLKYELDFSSNQLIRVKTITRSYATDAIGQDLDHMDAKTVDRKNEEMYFHYNLSDRTTYTNALGNMMPLPIKINRGKHNCPMEQTLSLFPSENLDGWIFDQAVIEFNKNSIEENGHRLPTEAFFDNRKSALLEYFKRIVKNQKYNPSDVV